ncbi:MAG: ATP synthase F1 subunit gamma [Bacteroidales bacterium]|nr:ATP synthase F1 subunit gamma [Bacteroidales bacterium]
MAGLKELKKRLSTVQQTEVMTSAMKMVSASKLRKAQGALYRAKAFAQKVNVVYDMAGGAKVRGVHGGTKTIVHKEEGRRGARALIVVIASNKGLCGSFNAAVCKEAELRFKKYSNAEFLCIGIKGYEYLNARKYPLCKEFDARAELKTYNEVAGLSRLLSQWYEKGRYDKIEIVYSHPLNAMSTERRTVSLLPLEEVDFSAGRAGVANVKGAADIANAAKTAGSKTAGVANAVSTADNMSNVDNVLFFPSRAEVAQTIIPLMVAALLYFFMMESAVAEHGARMTAMSQATDNAQTLGRELNLTYNKMRQQAITNELLEIIAGANAL